MVCQSWNMVCCLQNALLYVPEDSVVQFGQDVVEIDGAHFSLQLGTLLPHMCNATCHTHYHSPPGVFQHRTD
jgi:hypothetical protein